MLSKKIFFVDCELCKFYNNVYKKKETKGGIRHSNEVEETVETGCV